MFSDFAFFMLFFVAVLVVFVREFINAKKEHDGDKYYLFRSLSAVIVVMDLWILTGTVRDIVVYFGTK